MCMFTCRLACSLPVTMTLHPVLSHMPDCPLFGRDSNQVIQVCMCVRVCLLALVELLWLDRTPYCIFRVVEDIL